MLTRIEKKLSIILSVRVSSAEYRNYSYTEYPYGEFYKSNYINAWYFHPSITLNRYISDHVVFFIQPGGSFRVDPHTYEVQHPAVFPFSFSFGVTMNLDLDRK